MSNKYKRAAILDRHKVHHQAGLATINLKVTTMKASEKYEMIAGMECDKEMITEEINNIEERRQKLIDNNDYDEIDEFILGKWQRNKEEFKDIIVITIELAKQIKEV
jgi:hypothetical protein